MLSIPPRFWDKTYQSFKKVTNDSTGAAFGLKVHKFAKLLASNSLHEAYIDLQKYWPSNENSIVTRSSKVPDLEFNVQELTFLSSALGWDQKWYLPGDNLVKTDRASMSASLEMRLPILDQRVVEYSWRLSDELKVHNGKSKWLLRQVLYRYVPAKLIDRPKMGFSVPLAKWLKSDLKAWGDNLLSTSSLKRHGLLDASLIRRTWSEHQSGKFDHSHKLWTVLIFQAWYDKFIVKDHHE
ncbi:hypothetical protein A3765_08705 [Oleiphilus sp. HI0130]|nr:hypothetical protein A3765_08705 [Oleiphilus sp. HI0130]